MTRDPHPPRPPRPPRRRKRGAAPGAAPGLLQGDPTAPAPVLRVVGFTADQLTDRTVTDLAEVDALRRRGGKVWLDVTGVDHGPTMQALSERFGLHRLALEDVQNRHMRAKVEDYPEHTFVVLRQRDHSMGLGTELFAMFVADDLLITFQERAGDCFGPVRQRLQDAASRLRTSGVDYLAYALMDALVDTWFPVLEDIGTRIDACEDNIQALAPPHQVLPQIQELRRDLLLLRRALWPLRDLTAALARGDSPRFAAETRVYLRDVHDHALQLIDLLESERELGAMLVEVHLATVSNRLNEVMKVLTVISTIFIPLTFVSSIYGMNFHHMPELGWWWAYPVVLAVMAAIGVAMLWWFRRRRWL